MAILYIQIYFNLNSIKQEQKENKTFKAIFETPKMPRISTPALQDLFTPLTAAAERLLVILPEKTLPAANQPVCKVIWNFYQRYQLLCCWGFFFT